MLTAVMILIFLGSMRATVAVMLSIPLSALAAFLVLNSDGGEHQLDGTGRARARLLAPDRQLGRGTGEHLPPYGDGQIARGCGGDWRARGSAAGSGGDLYYSHRLLPGRLPLRRQPFLVYGAGALGGALALCVVCGRDDGCPALLRALHSQSTSEGAHRRRPSRWHELLSALCPLVQSSL